MILKSRGVIKNDRTEIYGVDGRCVNIENSFKYAYGGILFIDEAYNLSGVEITDLVALMEQHRNDVIVILAGYTDRMKDFIDRNEGLRSRLSYVLTFDDYTSDNLYHIFEKLIKDIEFIVTDEAKTYVKEIFSNVSKGKDYGNGRYVRKLIENARLNMDYRLATLNKKDYSIEELKTLTIDDFKTLEDDAILDKVKEKVGFAS